MKRINSLLPTVAQIAKDDINVFAFCACRAMRLYSKEELKGFYAAYDKITGRKTSEVFQRQGEERVPSRV